MKKTGKALILILLLGSFGIGGFFLGVNSRSTDQIAGNTGTTGSTGTTQVSDYGLTEDEQRILQNVREFSSVIENDYLFEYTAEDLENGIYKGLFAGLGDPYSVYYTGEEYMKLMEDTSGEFAGIGVIISAGEDNLITVVSPIDGTPASRAGLKSGDKIIAIDGVSYLAVDLEAASAKMRGEVGTEVSLTVQRENDGKIETFDVKIKREMIQITSVSSRMLEGDIGYLQINSFDEHTGTEFRENLDKLKGEGAKKLVLELRNNPGGLLSSLETVADILLGEGTIVTSVDNSGYEEVMTSDANQETMPIVVLVNEGSASASEILLGALRDHKRAISVGTKTFGKGIIQRIYPISEFDPSAGGFKLTMAEYMTPNGDRIHGEGITPDIVVELPEEVKGLGPDFLQEDTQLQRAIEEVKKLK